MKSNAWQEQRSESAKASDRIMAIEEAKDAVIEAAEAWAIEAEAHARGDANAENCWTAHKALHAAVAHLRSVRESK